MKVNRELVVKSALGLLNDVGLEALTLRRLASELKIQAPTLYWHFKSKDALINEMATLLLAEGCAHLLPARDTGDWKAWVSAFGNGLRKVLLGYRDGARMIAGTVLTDTVYMETVERIGTHLTKAGLPLRDAVVLLSTIYTFTISFVIEEQAVFPAPGERAASYDIEERKARLDPKKLPLLRRSGTILFDQFDRRYKESLDLIVRGASSKLSRP